MPKKIETLTVEGGCNSPIHSHARGKLKFWIALDSGYHKDMFASGGGVFSFVHLAIALYWQHLRPRTWAYHQALISKVDIQLGEKARPPKKTKE